jgi:NADPH:quinone reductase-like Zn-dependent oxidoreductase
MRLYRLTPSPELDGLRLCEEPVPQPGPREVLVKIHAASLNRRDVMIATGGFRHAIASGLIPASDAAGEIVALGEGVGRVALGERVCGAFYPTWLSGPAQQADGTHGLGGGSPGVLAEYRVFHEDAVVRFPAHLTYQQAATLPCAALTAWNALFGGPALRAGECVLILGTGGVSIFALQFAKAAGAETIVASSSDAKLARLAAIGPTHTINYRTAPKWDRAARDLTSGLGVDHVVDVVGGETLGRSILAAHFGGQVHMVGAQPFDGFDPRLILLRNVAVRGVMVGSRAMFEAMNRTIALHAIAPVISATVPFENAPDAYRLMDAADHFGKIVITVA